MFRLWFVLLGSALCATTATAREIPDDIYVLSGAPADVQRVRSEAVERSVMSVSWLFRGFARRRLAKVATACPAYQLVVRDPHFEVKCDGNAVFVWTLGKTGTWTTETGDVVDVLLTEKPGGFELQFTSGDSGKRFTYIYGENGTLRVSQRIHSGMLPVPVEYGLDYVVAPSAR
ncbi:MAG: hypothetical protein AB8H79_22615 [Myxococcota bacterium]